MRGHSSGRPLPGRGGKGGGDRDSVDASGEHECHEDLNPDVRASLLRHLAISPDRTKLVLLAHLRDIQDPNDMHPIRSGCRRPT
jgi:hypothetical protein